MFEQATKRTKYSGCSSDDLVTNVVQIGAEIFVVYYWEQPRNNKERTKFTSPPTQIYMRLGLE